MGLISISSRSDVDRAFLLFLDCGIRPNTLYEVRNLATFADGPGGTHWNLPSATTGSGHESAGSPGSDMDEYDVLVSDEEAARLDDEDAEDDRNRNEQARSGDGFLG